MLWVTNDRFRVFARCPLLPRKRPNRCVALGNAPGQKETHALADSRTQVGVAIANAIITAGWSPLMVMDGGIVVEELAAEAGEEACCSPCPASNAAS